MTENSVFEENKAEYVLGSHIAFYSAVHNASDESTVLDRGRAQGLKFQVREYLKGSKLFASSVSGAYEGTSYERLIQGLLTGIEDGTLVLENTDDVALFAFVLMAKKFDKIGQVIEYYSRTGELLEVMRHIEPDMLDELGESTALLGMPHLIRGTESCVRLYQLYCYDMERTSEHLADGGDIDDFTDVPMYARVEFAGVAFDPDFDYRSGDIDFSVDHNSIFPDEFFARFADEMSVSA